MEDPKTPWWCTAFVGDLYRVSRSVERNLLSVFLSIYLRIYLNVLVVSFLMKISFESRKCLDVGNLTAKIK